MLENILSEADKEQIKEINSVLLLLTIEERAILLSNANAFKVRRDMEKARKNL